MNGGEWELGDIMCDTWVALDVMCCTASILNLAAIGVDRCAFHLHTIIHRVESAKMNK